MQLPNAYAQHKGGTRSLRDSRWFSIDLTLDLLGGCEHQCPGCFVNRKLPFLDDDLKVVDDLVDKWEQADVDFNELFLGPTDLFSASNFYDIITNPYFHKLSKHFTFTCTTTCLNDPTETKQKLLALDDYCSNWRGRNFEVFVIIDIPKYLNNDKEYLDLFKENLQHLYQDNVFMLLNVYGEDMFNDMSLFDFNKKVKEDFNTKVRINPSYFRGTSKRHIENYAHAHKRMLEREINEDTIKGIFLNMIDVYFGGHTFGNYSFTNHNLYVTPLLYEGVPIVDDAVCIPRGDDGMYHLDDLQAKHRELFDHQHFYSKRTTECDSCKYLASCVSRNVLSYMESREIQDCFLPKSLFRDASRVIELEKNNVAG